MRLIPAPLTAAARALLALARQYATGQPCTNLPLLPEHDPGAPAPRAAESAAADNKAPPSPLSPPPRAPQPDQEEIGAAIARQRTALVTLMWAYHTTSTNSQMRRYGERTTAQYAFAAARTRTIGPFSLN